MKILVLEDDPVMRETLRSILDEEGYTVCAVAAGVEAISQVKSSSFDLLIADVRMEGMDGLTAIEHVRRLTPGIRCLVVSGYCNEADTIRALRLGVGDFIKKPFELQDLVEAVQRLLRQKLEDDQNQADREALRTAWLLALDSQALLFDSQDPTSRFSRTEGLGGVGEWARGLALDQGLSVENAQEVCIVSLFWALAKLRPSERLKRLEASFAPSLKGALELLRGGGQGHPVADMAVAVLRYAGLGEREVPELLKQGVPPPLVESLRRLEENGLESVRDTGRQRHLGQQRRGLLALAVALENKGDLAGAKLAYEAVIPESEHSLEWVQATMALARLQLLLGDQATFLDLAERALQGAADLGPNNLAQTRCKIAMLARKFRLEWSVELLREACEALSDSKGSLEWSLARLALWVVKPELLEPGELASLLSRLRQPIFSDALASSAGWLTPSLLTRCPREAESEALLLQVARLFPGEFGQLVRLGELSEQDRDTMVGMLTGVDNPWAHRCLELLSPKAGTAHTSEQDVDSDTTLIRLYTLGAFDIFRGEERMPDRSWKRLKNRLMFARLASAEGAVPEDILIEDFWPGDADKGRQNVYSAVSVMRRCLAGEKGARVEVVARSGLGLTLSPELPLWHDLKEVQESLRRAGQADAAGRHQEAYEHLRRVYQLYRGPFLEGCYQDWAVSLRHGLENEIMLGFSKLCGWLEEQQRGEELGEFARWMLSVDPCSQQAHLSFMRSLLMTDRPEEAVRHFERARVTLAQELAMEPSIELLREHQKALLSIT